MSATQMNNRAISPFLQSGRFLLAIPMLAYGIVHWQYAHFITTFVPPWAPWHLFWIYFTGTALLAAGLAIAARKVAYLAGVLLGAMILSFVILIHTRLLLHMPSDAFAAQKIFDFPFYGRVSNACKDLGLSGAAFLFAGTQAPSWKTPGRNWAFTLGRFLFGIPILGFGILHFVSTAYAPGVPPMLPSIHSPLPWQPFWDYLTGAVFLITGSFILLNRNLRIAGTLLGFMILIFGLIVWAPPLLAHPRDILASNFLKDVGVAGGAWLLACAVPVRATQPLPQAATVS
jgi:putative oxidoreductase